MYKQSSLSLPRCYIFFLDDMIRLGIEKPMYRNCDCSFKQTLYEWREFHSIICLLLFIISSIFNPVHKNHDCLLDRISAHLECFLTEGILWKEKEVYMQVIGVKIARPLKIRGLWLLAGRRKNGSIYLTKTLFVHPCIWIWLKSLDCRSEVSV